MFIDAVPFWKPKLLKVQSEKRDCNRSVGAKITPRPAQDLGRVTMSDSVWGGRGGVFLFCSVLDSQYPTHDAIRLPYFGSRRVHTCSYQKIRKPNTAYILGLRPLPVINRFCIGVDPQLGTYKVYISGCLGPLYLQPQAKKGGAFLWNSCERLTRGISSKTQGLPSMIFVLLQDPVSAAACLQLGDLLGGLWCPLAFEPIQKGKPQPC